MLHWYERTKRGDQNRYLPGVWLKAAVIAPIAVRVLLVQCRYSVRFDITISTSERACGSWLMYSPTPAGETCRTRAV